MKKIAVFSVKNKDISHNSAFRIGIMSVMNMVISSWTIHTKYLLQELKCHITNHTKVTLPDHIWGTSNKIKTGKVNPDHSLTTEGISAQIIMIYIEAALDHSIWIGAATTGMLTMISLSPQRPQP